MDNGSHAAQPTPVVPVLTQHRQAVTVIKDGIDKNDTTSTRMAGKPPVHHVFSSASNGLSVPLYNGGFRGSTQDKRKFFELVAQKQVPDEPPPRRQHVPKIKCRTSDRFLDLVAMDRSVTSDAGTDISGYDSVAPDFATDRDSRQLASGNLTPVRYEIKPQFSAPLLTGRHVTAASTQATTSGLMRIDATPPKAKHRSL